MKTLPELLSESVARRKGVDLRRRDIRVDPQRPGIGPYFVVKATYQGTLTEENQDTLLISALEKDNTPFESFSQLESIFKERAEDAFDPRGRSLNGKNAVWQLDSDSERYHISSRELMTRARQIQIPIDLIRPQLKFPDEKSPPASSD